MSVCFISQVCSWHHALMMLTLLLLLVKRMLRFCQTTEYWRIWSENWGWFHWMSWNWCCRLTLWVKKHDSKGFNWNDHCNHQDEDRMEIKWHARTMSCTTGILSRWIKLRDQQAWNCKSTVEMLLHASNVTCPGITFAESQVAGFTAQLRVSHAEAIKAIVWHLAVTLDEEILAKSNGTFALKCWVNTNFAGLHRQESHLNPKSVRFQCGHNGSFGWVSVVWRLQNQHWSSAIAQLMPSVCWFVKHSSRIASNQKPNSGHFRTGPSASDQQTYDVLQDLWRTLCARVLLCKSECSHSLYLLVDGGCEVDRLVAKWNWNGSEAVILIQWSREKSNLGKGWCDDVASIMPSGRGTDGEWADGKSGIQGICEPGGLGAHRTPQTDPKSACTQMNCEHCPVPNTMAKQVTSPFARTDSAKRSSTITRTSAGAPTLCHWRSSVLVGGRSAAIIQRHKAFCNQVSSVLAVCASQREKSKQLASDWKDVNQSDGCNRLSDQRTDSCEAWCQPQTGSVMVTDINSFIHTHACTRTRFKSCCNRWCVMKRGVAGSISHKGLTHMTNHLPTSWMWSVVFNHCHTLLDTPLSIMLCLTGFDFNTSCLHSDLMLSLSVQMLKVSLVWSWFHWKVNTGTTASIQFFILSNISTFPSNSSALLQLDN